MKITAKQFALALLEAVDGKSAAQVKVTVKKFAEMLKEKHRLVLAERIINEFSKIWNQRHGVVEAEVVSAKSLDKETVKSIKNYIIKLAGAKEAVISEATDKNLLGGVVIKYGDKVLDGSLKGSLQELKEKLIK